MERLGDTGEGDIVILCAIQQKVVAADSLAVDGELSRLFLRLQETARGLDHAGKGARQRDRVQADQWKLAHLTGQKVFAAQRAVPNGERFGFRAHLDSSGLTT